MKSLSSWVLVASIAVVLASQTQNAQADPLDHWTTNQVLYAIYPGYYYGLEQVVYGNGIYLAYGQEGDAGGFFTSPDGYNWTFQYSEANSWGLPPLGYANGHYFGCAERGLGPVNVSSDGTNWTTTFLPSPYNSLTHNGYPAMTYGNGVYVLAGDTNNVASILTSPNGVTWTSRGFFGATIPGGPITSIAYGAGEFVAVGTNDGLEYTSTTGTGNWFKRSIPGGSQITFCGNLFLVPFTSNSDLISADGIHWTMANTGLTNQLGNIIYSHGIYLAASGLCLASSMDGTNWYQYPQPIPDNPRDYENLPPPHLGSMATDGYHLVKVAWEQGSYIEPPGMVYTSDALAGVRMNNQPAHGIVVSGLVGRNYQIQSMDSLGTVSNWRTNATVQLTNTPYVWTDSTATNSMRFYRAALLP